MEYLKQTENIEQEEPGWWQASDKPPNTSSFPLRFLKREIKAR